jgi:hypothetical protein
MHVLIVEDDLALGRFLEKGLTLDGHDVVVAGERRAGIGVCGASAAGGDDPGPGTAAQGWAGGAGGDAGAVPVDIGGGVDGRAEMEERVRCLELGADDLVLKPFSLP